MSTMIYLIRHGESEGNHLGVFLGHYDLELTQLGRKQACMAADYLIKTVGRPDAIYASDLKRAYETAKCTADCMDMEIRKNQNLREIFAGQWENVPFTTITEKFPESYGVWLSDIGRARCDGGESVEQLQQRVVSAVTHIAKEHENGVVFLFTHATPVRVFAAHCLQKTLSEIKTIPWATNASVTKAVYDGEAFQLLEYSCCDFMGDLITKLPLNV